MASKETSATTLELDGSFGKFLKGLPEKPSTTIRFFDRGEFFSAHHEDANLVAKDYYRTMGVVRQLGSENSPIPSVTVSKSMFESVVRDLLLVRQYRVEMWSRVNRSSTFTLSKKASPGNLQHFEDYIFRNHDVESTSSIMAVNIGPAVAGGKTIGVSYCDVVGRKMGVCEFTDNDQFTTFESLVVQLGAKECLTVDGSAAADNLKLIQIAERSGMLVTHRKKTSFQIKDIAQDLDRLLMLPTGSSAAALPEMDLKYAMGSASTLISYLSLLENEDNFESFTLDRFDNTQCMRLDMAAASALNLFPSNLHQGNKTASIFGVLDNCKTAQGKRLLAQFIKQPLLDKAKIDERLNLVEAFFNDSNLRDAVREDILRKMPDLNRIAKKFYRHKASLQDIVRVYQAVEHLPALQAMLEEHDSNFSTLIGEVFCTPVKEAQQEFEKFIALVDTTVDMEATDNNEYLIRDDYSPKLKELRESMSEEQDKVPAIGQNAANDLGLEFGKAMKLESDSKLGYFFRVTRTHDKILRAQKNAFQTIETQKAGIKFTNKRLKAVNEAYKEFKKEYEREQESVVSEVLKIAGGYAAVMESVNDTLALLDVIQSFANVSNGAPIPFVRPVIHEKGKGIIKLTESRHPCVELQDDVSFIANDVDMVHGTSQFQIITGPNMGGKSTYIRQIGVNVLMAQIGCFVPCASAEVTVVDSILARVGAGDSQLKGVSTFMAEMLETASILKSATKDSLIIVDELGRGTSTYDGFGLAWAISEHICNNLQSFCLFATHFHELTKLEAKGVTNLNVKAHTGNGTLTLLYQVKPGICDQSFGINVAELANFPDAVVQDAKRKASELEDFSNESEDKKRQRQEKADEIMKTFVSKAREIPTEATPTKRIELLRTIKSDLSISLLEAGIDV
eukprot:m.13470 g.13470  ORF g.13470 m.13470 type:complete len:905 (-) comp9744_c0_seq1:34-2748(-)